MSLKLKMRRKITIMIFNNLPYLFLLVPLIFSAFNILQNYKFTNFSISIVVCASIFFLSVYMSPYVFKGGIIENQINNELIFLIGEYKISFLNIFFLLTVFFFKSMSFLFFDNSLVNTKKLNFFFSVFLINCFAMAGILMSNNIFNIYIYMELYSFTFYTLMSNYKGKNFANIAYEYYINGVSASILLMLFVIIVYFNFGTADLNHISEIVETSNVGIAYNMSSIILLLALLLKFFFFNTYFKSISKSQDITNIFFINILFLDVPIGIYITLKLFNSLFNDVLIFDLLYIKYILYAIGTFIILRNSYHIYKRKNLLSNVYSFAMITTGYILINIGIGSVYATTSIFLFVLNHLVVNFLFYIVVAMLLFLFQKSQTVMLYVFRKYSIIIYLIIASKLMLPIGFGFDSFWFFMLAIIEKGDYYLFIPILLEKIAMITLFVRFYYSLTQEKRKAYTYLNLEDEISFRLKHVLPVSLVLFLLIISTLFSKIIVETILKFSITIG